MTTMQEIKDANRRAGRYWFEASTMRFFESRVGDTVYEGPGGVYFVSSERFRGSDGKAADRLYTVRRFFPETGEISTIGQFNVLTRRQAINRAWYCAGHGPEVEQSCEATASNSTGADAVA